MKLLNPSSGGDFEVVKVSPYSHFSGTLRMSGDGVVWTATCQITEALLLGAPMVTAPDRLSPRAKPLQDALLSVFLDEEVVLRDAPLMGQDTELKPQSFMFRAIDAGQDVGIFITNGTEVKVVVTTSAGGALPSPVKLELPAFLYRMTSR